MIFNIPAELAQMLENGVNKVETHMPPGEVEFCRECIAKYNDDYKVQYCA
jgi:hypothetical protein